MEIFTELPSESPPQSIAIGTFDGLHPGHQSIIRTARKSAEERSLVSAVLTFEPDPVTVLSDQIPQDRRLLTREDKISILKELSIDNLYEIQFDREFASLSADEFVTDVLVNRLNAKEVSVGYDFRFGNERQGDTELLGEIMSRHGARVQVMDPVTVDGEPLSSSKIRDFIRSGHMRKARRFMKRPYTVHETVEEGEGRGKSIGFPTINFPLKHTIHPRKGVYLVWIGTRRRIPSIANFGYRPTVDSSTEKPVLEVHTLDDPPKLAPGDKDHVYFEEFVREEREFDSVDDLRDQIARDKNQAKQRFETLDKPSLIHDNSGIEASKTA